MRKKKEDTCLLSPRSAYMNCSRPGSGNKCCNFSIAPILPRDKLSCTTHSETIKYQIFTTNPCHSSWPHYHRYKPTLEWKQPPQQQKKKQQENTNLDAPHAVCIHSCSVKKKQTEERILSWHKLWKERTKPTSDYQHGIGYCCMYINKRKEREEVSVVVVHTTMVTRWPSSSKRNAACDPM